MPPQVGAGDMMLLCAAEVEAAGCCIEAEQGKDPLDTLNLGNQPTITTTLLHCWQVRHTLLPHGQARNSQVTGAPCVLSSHPTHC